MRIIIVGGGITGLSAAWYCKKKYPDAKITLLEKEGRLGGWIRTCTDGGHLFEKGPRTFQMSRSPHLLELIKELNLEMVLSSPLAKKRYILHKGKLKTPGSFLPKLFPYFVRELFVKKGSGEDESIYNFAARRFSPKIAELFFDPLTLGIYGGDIRKLSVRSCFPAFYRWEQENGSVIKGLFSMPKSKERGLFTLKGGMERLIHALEKRLDIDIVLNCAARKITEHEVEAGGRIWSADRVISALPPQLPHLSLWVVNLAFSGDVLKKKGFGYLVPTKENESLMGCIFDSVIFPNESRTTRLSAMVRFEEKNPIEAALYALQRHQKIKDIPIYASSFLAKNAIPQFEVGCGYTGGVSVDACVQRGKKYFEPQLK